MLVIAIIAILLRVIRGAT
ncbi:MULTISPECIES: hypothetical protein [Olivibacter]|uniref:Uncharacterized protein n=1 Tax=Olivibacter oleidegradans TaxID=760123 RepID=A0ABV6HH89_9SPHI